MKHDHNLNHKVTWSSLPGSQSLAMTCPANHILYDGTRGPGKTDTQLMRFRRHVGLGYGMYWRGVIFDREYKNLDDLVNKSRRWFPQLMGPKARFLASKSDYKWVWETGEELLFRTVKSPEDYWNYHGQEFPFIGWNELTKYPTAELYDKLMSCNRVAFVPKEHTPIRYGDNGGPLYDYSGDEPELVYDTADGKPLPPIPQIVFSTTNPHGSGHNWVKRRFIDPSPPGKLLRKTVTVFDPRTQEEIQLTKTQVRIKGHYKENRYLTPEYVAELDGIKDPNLKAAWADGSWDVTAGGVFDDLWKNEVHLIDRFAIPSNWYIDRAFDWGSSHPFSVGFWAEANGEEVELSNGKIFCPPAGTLIRFDEIYGSVEIGTNKGLKWGSKKIAEAIKTREKALLEAGWINAKIYPGPADNQIRNVTDNDTETIEAKMSDAGIVWESSDKSKGSREVGVQLARDRLEAALTGEGPGLYVMRNCASFAETFPSLPRDETKIDDVDTDAEDHQWDEARYRILKSNNRTAKSIKVTLPT